MKLVFFSFSLLISCFCLRLNYRKKALAFENIHNLAEIFPEILKDENQDGFSDKYDFINIISANQSSTPPYLNKIDIIGIFLQVDINKDGLISKREWKQFYKNFVLEFFEKCDQNKDYLLNQNELKECLNEESNQLLKKGIFDFHKLIKFMMFEGKIDQINFLEYLKAKNFMKSWIYCSKNSSHINSKQFLCSINISHMELDVEKSQIASLFLTGRKLSRQSLKKELPNETLNFYIFFNLNMKFHCFSKNQKFMGKLSLNKKEFFDTTFRSYEFPIDFQGFFLMKEYILLF